MGLDITALTKLTPALDAAVEDGYATDEGYWHANKQTIEWTENNWPGRTKGVQPDATYSAAGSFDFRAGSYSGYNQWRDWLARLAGYPSARHIWNNEITEGPFIEQLNFADNEGVIGPEIASKLAKDYREFREKALAYAGADRDWLIAKYDDWTKAFEMAAEGGAVEFH